jgi:twitching motility protein PilT
LNDERIKVLASSILTDRQRQILDEKLQIDFCYTIPNVGRYRANVFIQRLGMGAVFRVIPGIVPTFRDIGMPTHMTDLVNYHQGLIVVAGPSGAGKSTTLAALVNLFNENKRAHILTIEDPVEFVHPMKNCLVNQREVGKHTQSFAAALKGALREDPDVIMVGEMRDNETMKMALEAGETGHLVIATLNTTAAPKTVDRLIESFPPAEQQQVRTALSESLKAVICQNLMPRADGKGRVALFEILMGSPTVRTLIRDSKTYQLLSAMQIGRSQGMRTVDMSLLELVQQKAITPEAAYLRALDKSTFEPMVKPSFLREMVGDLEATDGHAQPGQQKKA